MPGGRVLRIICVNLDRSTERWVSIQRQASQLGLVVERFSAVDGSKLNPLPFPIAAGAVGCFLSHRGIWERIMQGSDEYVLVLEDDALLSSDLPAFLQDTSWIPGDADLVHIGGSDPRCSIEGFPRPAKGRKLFRSIKCTGTEGYIITKRCAAVLLKDMVYVDKEFDQVLFNGGRNDLKIYKIFPALCTQDRKNLSSTIERISKGISKERVPMLKKIKREIGKGWKKFLYLFRLQRRVSVVFR